MTLRIRPEQYVRLQVVVVTAAIAIACVGFLSGIREVEGQPPESSPVAAPRSSDVSDAQSYSELREHRRGLNGALYTGAIDRLGKMSSGMPPLGEENAEDRRRTIADRAGQRAYVGAPPLIPHAIDQRAVPNCLSCHQNGAMVAGRKAPLISHRPLGSCTQCHVVRDSPRSWPQGGVAMNASADTGQGQTALGLHSTDHTSAVDGLTVVSESPGVLAVNNGFSGLGSLDTGGRAWAGAPPTIPHTTWMREDCKSCHGERGLLGLRTSHPERQNCRQCHGLSAVLEQR